MLVKVKLQFPSGKINSSCCVIAEYILPVGG